MKVVMTLIARDEADIVDAQVAFHLNAGVDFVVAIDNGSTDGTTEILEAYARDGYLHLLRDEDDLVQDQWVTRLARTAASEFDADWVVNADADEFWWPRGGSLKEILAAVPARFGSVRGMWRHFPPRPGGDDFFAERMTIRICDPGSRADTPYSARFKTVHRGDPSVTVRAGNHRVDGRQARAVRGWYPIDVLHFPIRSLRQCEQKYLRWFELFGGTKDAVWTAAHDARRENRMREFYESYVPGDEAVEKGVAEGRFALDTRLRDALRTLRSREARRTFALPPDAPPLSFDHRALEPGYLAELAVLEETDAFVHAQRRLEALETRLASLEARPLARIGGRLFARMTAGAGG